jgi:hypothetical protein
LRYELDLRLFAVDKFPEKGTLVPPKHVGVDPEYEVNFTIHFIAFILVHFFFFNTESMIIHGLKNIKFIDTF